MNVSIVQNKVWKGINEKRNITGVINNYVKALFIYHFV